MAKKSTTPKRTKKLPFEEINGRMHQLTKLMGSAANRIVAGGEDAMSRVSDANKIKKWQAEYNLLRERKRAGK